LLVSAFSAAALATVGVVSMHAPVATGHVEPGGLTLRADAKRKGWIRLVVNGRVGTTVTVQEVVAGGTVPVANVALTQGSAVLPAAAVWRCDRRVRDFVATAPAPDGSIESATARITTRSCRGRIEVSTRPRRPRAQRPVIVRLRDRWGVGDVSTRVCVRAPGRHRPRCHRTDLAAGERRASRRFRATRSGRWRVRVSGPGLTTQRRGLLVRRAGGGLRVLATGDSMIQIIDSFLQQRIGSKPGISVRSDAHISTGISKPFLLNWVQQARRQARSERPDVVVMFLGANDGFPIAGAPCCGHAWVKRYAGRARSMMRSYARGGRTTVYWLLLPTPREATFQRVFRAVNAALLRAAKHYPGEVRLLDLRRTFTPGGQFRSAMRWHGRTVTVRQGDGVHLSVTGASIAASLILRAMRRDGAIG
jgi:lysophospholipase L1-like esterase